MQESRNKPSVTNALRNLVQAGIKALLPSEPTPWRRAMQGISLDTVAFLNPREQARYRDFANRVGVQLPTREDVQRQNGQAYQPNIPEIHQQWQALEFDRKILKVIVEQSRKNNLERVVAYRDGLKSLEDEPDVIDLMRCLRERGEGLQLTTGSRHRGVSLTGEGVRYWRAVSTLDLLGGRSIHIERTPTLTSRAALKLLNENPKNSLEYAWDQINRKRQEIAESL